MWGCVIHTIGKSGLLVIMSDIHVGAQHHEERRFDEALAWCVEHDANIFLNGDLIENSIIVGKSPGEMLLDQAKYPTEQVIEFCQKLKPLARRGKIVGVTRGNHEARSRRESLLDLCELIAAHLNVPYYGIGGYVRFKHGQNVYLGGIHHGRSGAKNIWSELDKMSALYPAADFVACGHNHALDCRRVNSLHVDPTGTEGVKSQWQIRTGTYLGFSDYAREMVLPPSASGSPILSFSPTRDRSVHVNVSTLRWV